MVGECFGTNSSVSFLEDGDDDNAMILLSYAINDLPTIHQHLSGVLLIVDVACPLKSKTARGGEISLSRSDAHARADLILGARCPLCEH